MAFTSPITPSGIYLFHRKSFAALSLILGMANVIPAAHATTYTITILNDPGALSFDANGISTSAASAINNKGTIVGGLYRSNFGFIYENGKYTTIAFPGSTQTIPTGINDNNVAVGTYVDSSHVSHGFIYHDGVYSSFSVISDPSVTTEISGINNSGQIIGATYGPDLVQHGFVYQHGIVTPIVDPNSYLGSTTPSSINNKGQIIGRAYSQTVGSLNFLDDNGKFSSIPGFVSGVDFAWSLNDNGQIVGDKSGNGVEFGLVDTNGIFQKVSAGGGGYPGGGGYTDILGINDLGDIVGLTESSVNTFNGFVGIAVPGVPLPPALPMFASALVGLGMLKLGRRNPQSRRLNAALFRDTAMPPAT